MIGVNDGNIAADMYGVFKLLQIERDVVDYFASLKACLLSS